MYASFIAFLSRFDPRHRLSTAIGWLVFGLAFTLALVAAAWVGQIVRTNLIQQHNLRLSSTADHIASELNLALSLRLQSVSLSAAMLSGDIRSKDKANLQRVLADVQQNFPDFVWIAAGDADGHIVASTDPKVIGGNVYLYTWASQGQIVPWIEEGVSYNDQGRKELHFIKLTAPIRGDNGSVLGVIAARMAWDWVQELADDINRSMNHASREEWLLIDRHNIVRVGPKELLGQPWEEPTPPIPAVLSEYGLGSLPPNLALYKLNAGRSYLVAQARAEDNESLEQLGWHVVVVQPLNEVMDFATRVQYQIASVLLGLGLAATVLGFSLARRLTRRVRLIARSADDVLAGTAKQIAVPDGQDEAARLGAALDRLLRALQRERDDLRSLNAELDQRVAARTQEIQRLAEEARYAAVVRERLKIARDLHDTLAHSMMAMLTEIRLLKKIAATQPEALADELAEAEKAAHQGLQEARAAIGQIRYNPARDVGLGVALQDRLRLFGERTGIDTSIDCDPALATFSEERAETLFRITEEALRNVEKHAGANRVTISFNTMQGNGRTLLCLRISDDGIGFDPHAPHPGHYGLVGLREQANLINAQIDILSQPGQGTQIVVMLPLASDVD
ncbi:MAG TPA: histidine kinase [Rhodocyclaceae bacterium]|nr:histidine kinase [Rhodocyclaceae bacterium]